MQDQEREEIRSLIKSRNLEKISDLLSTANEDNKFFAFTCAINENLLDYSIVSNARVVHLFRGKMPMERISNKINERISLYNQYLKKERTQLETHHREKERLSDHAYDTPDLSSGDWADRVGAYTMKVNYPMSGGRQREEERINQKISSSEYFIRQLGESIKLLRQTIE